MNYILLDTEVRNQLLPFTHTRPVADIRCGIMTMRERWEGFLGTTTATLTLRYLNDVYPFKATDENIFINASIMASKELIHKIHQLSFEEAIFQNDIFIAAKTGKPVESYEDFLATLSTFKKIDYDQTFLKLEHIWDIFSLNDHMLKEDFITLTENKTSAPLPENITVIGKENIFLEEGAKIQAGCIINAATGPVYLAKNSEILEGCMIRGPLSLGENAVVKMGAKIYGATTIGNGSKVGGEISNVVFFDNSNKGHDGYLGNAVIGSWCNLGADTNCSNLKNNYDTIKIWDEHQNKSIKTGLQFCGLLMGDHSKCGINTMFNTGTVVGVSANIYGGGFPEKFIPSFAWGGSEGMTTYSFDKAMDTAARMMVRRKLYLSEAEKNMYRHIFEATQYQRDLFTTS